MSDPDFVKLAAGITVLSDPTTAWGLSQNSVAAFPSGVGEATLFVGRSGLGNWLPAPKRNMTRGFRPTLILGRSWAQWGEVDPP